MYISHKTEVEVGAGETQWRDRKVRKLNGFMSVSQIARRLDMSRLGVTNWIGVTPQQVKTRRPLPVATTQLGKAHRYHIREADLLSWLGDYRPDLVTKWNENSTWTRT